MSRRRAAGSLVRRVSAGAWVVAVSALVLPALAGAEQYSAGGPVNNGFGNGGPLVYTDPTGDRSVPQVTYAGRVDQNGTPYFHVTVQDGNTQLTAPLPSSCGQAVAQNGYTKTVECDIYGPVGMTINTGEGDDTVKVLPGTAGSTTIVLGPGIDTAYGGAGQDLIAGDAGEDYVYLSPGGDAVGGGEGPDQIALDQAFSDGTGATFDLTGGASGESGWNATLSGDFESVIGTPGPDTMIGDDDGEGFYGADGTDVVTANGGNDAIDMGFGGGSVSAGAGDDIIRIRTWPMAIDGGVEGVTGDWLFMYGLTSTPFELGAVGLTEIENLFGGPSDNVIKGDSQVNLLRGGDGNDVITGGGGADTLYGEAGDDLLKSAGDGAVDTDDCGSGTDGVEPDANDVVNANCENTGVLISQGPTGLTGSTDATFGFEMPGAPPGKFECELDGVGFAECTSPKDYQGLTDGQHVFKVRFVPTGGEPGIASERTWTVDVDVPVLIVDSSPTATPGTTIANDVTITFHSSEPAGATFVCKLDTDAEYDCSSPQDLHGLANGAHSFTMATFDQVGHRSASVTVSWTSGGGATPGASETPGPTPAPGPPAVVSGECPPLDVPEVKMGVIVARAESVAACFKPVTLSGKLVRVSTGPVKVNGVGIRPEPGAEVQIGSNQDGYVKVTGPSRFSVGLLTFPVPFAFQWSGLATKLVGNAFSFVDTAQGEKPDDALGKFKLFNLAAKVSPTIELTAADGGTLKMTAKLVAPGLVLRSLPVPGSTETKDDKGLTFEVNLTTSNDKGADFGGKAKIDEAYLLGRMKLKDIEVAIDPAGPALTGGASLLLGQSIPGTEDKLFRTELAFGPNGFFGGILRRFAFTASGLNRPIGGTPIFLQGFGGEASRLDTPLGLKVAGSAKLTGGPEIAFGNFKGAAVGVDGSVSFELPDGVEPWTIEVKGAGRIGDIPVADITVKHDSDAQTALSGTLGFKTGQFTVQATVAEGKGWISPGAYSVTAAGTVAALGWTGTGEAAFSQAGFTACAGTAPTRRGVGKKWGETLKIFGSACDISPYSQPAPTAARAAQYASRTIVVPAGRKLQAIEAVGTTGPPGLTISDPSGFSLTTPAGSLGLVRADAEVIKDPATRTTHVLLINPKAGSYTIVGTSGPFTLRTANELPAVSVRASVSGSGERRRLSWSLRKISGQRVEFFERSRTGTHRLLATSAAQGVKRFRPNPSLGSGPRRIEALVSQYGLPRRTLSLARYRVTLPKPRRVSGLRRRGSQLSWRKQAGVTYVAALAGGNGTTVSVSSRKASVTIPKALRRGKLLVRVVAVDVSGRAGPVKGPVRLEALARLAHDGLPRVGVGQVPNGQRSRSAARIRRHRHTSGRIG